MNRHKSIAALMFAAALVSCDYEKNAVQDITGVAPESGIRFFNFAISAPSVNFYAGERKVTAVSSGTCTTPPLSETCTTTGSESTSGIGYGGVGSGGFYTGLEPGQYTFTGKIAATVDKDLPITSMSATLENGKKYSYYMSGVYDATTKKSDAFIVEDPYPAKVDWSAAHVRFVNAIYNANAMTLYAKDQVTGTEYPIGGTIAYKSAGVFTPVPNGVYDLSTRYAGSSTNVLTRTGVGFEAGSVYSITAKGDITVAPTTTACAAATRTCLDNTTHR